MGRYINVKYGTKEDYLMDVGIEIPLSELPEQARITWTSPDYAVILYTPPLDRPYSSALWLHAGEHDIVNNLTCYVNLDGPWKAFLIPWPLAEHPQEPFV